MSFFESSKTRSTLSYRVTNKIHIFSPFPGAQFLKPGAIEDGTMVAQKKKTGGGLGRYAARLRSPSFTLRLYYRTVYYFAPF